jgi:hypothetical protein
MAKKSQDSLKEIVGDKVYSVWVDMLHRLVPDGRTHRLAPTIACMLRYASEVAYEKYSNKPEEKSVAYSLYIVSEGVDYDEAMDLLLPIVERLFKDSRVESKRISSRGEEYSIAEFAIQEFVNWYSMPWES